MLKSKSLWACIVIIVLIIVFAPFVDGIILEKSVKRYVAHLNYDKKPEQITITSYKKGWFSSNMTFKVDDLTGKIKLNHGPVTFDHGIHFGLASIPHGKIKLWDYGHTNITGNITLNGGVSLAATTTFSDKDIAAIKKSIAAAGEMKTLKIGSVVLKLNSNRDLTKVWADGAINHLVVDVRDPATDKKKPSYMNFSAKVEKAELSATATRSKGGDDWVVVPALNIVNASGQSPQENISISVAQLLISDLRIDQGAVMGIMMAAMEEKQDPSKYEKQALNEFAGLFTHKTHFKISKLTVKTPEFNGTISFDEKFENLPKGKTPTFEDISKYGTVKVDINLPKVDINGFKLTDGKVTLVNDGLYRMGNAAKATISIGELDATKVDQPLYLKNLIANANVKLSTNKVGSLAYKVSADHVKVNNVLDGTVDVKNINLDIALNDIVANTRLFSNDYLNAITALRQGKSFKDAFGADPGKHFEARLTDNSKVELNNLSFDIVSLPMWPLKDQKFKFSGSAAWPQLKENKDMIGGMDFSLKALVPQQTIWYFIPALSSKLWHKTNSVPYSINQVPATLANNQFVRVISMVPSFVDNNIILDNNGNYTIDLVSQKGMLSVNGAKPDALQSAYVYTYLGLYPQGLALLQSDALKNNATAQNIYANYLLYGWGVKQDKDQAIKLRQAAVAKQDITAIMNLSHDYYMGVGVTADYNKTLSLLKVAASKTPAAYMSLCYAYGRGQLMPPVTKPNGPMAIKWCQKAVDAGYKDAYALMSGLYASSDYGLQQNLVKAAEYLIAGTYSPALSDRFNDQRLASILAKMDKKDLAAIANDAMEGNTLVQKSPMLVYIANSLLKTDVSSSKSALTAVQQKRAERILNLVKQQ